MLPALFAKTRLTALGVALVVGASAALGAVLPKALPNFPAAAWNGVADIVPVKHLPGHSLFPLVGRELRGAAGADIGQIAEVLVDGWGRPRAVVVDFGGFLGVGSRKVAVDWRALRFYRAGKREVLIADVGPAQLARAPQYEATDRPVAVVSPRVVGYGP